MMTLISYVAAVLTTIAYVPQALQVIKTKNTEGLSLSMYGIMVTGVTLWTIYGFATGEYAVGIANAITLILASIILGYKIKDLLVKKDK
ncbi:MAG: SemiSWEET transporter [Turicibacter sp.]